MEEIKEPVNMDSSYSVNLGLPDLKNFAGWATFTAIIDIIVGALSSLLIITAAYGVPQIIAGVRLLNAADNLKFYLTTNDSRKISEAFVNLNKYFKFTGISIIGKIIFGILGIIAYIILIGYLISNYPDFMNTTPGMEF